MAALRRQGLLLDFKPFEGFNKLEYLGLIFVANGQGAKEIKGKISRPFSILSPANLPWRKI